MVVFVRHFLQMSILSFPPDQYLHGVCSALCMLPLISLLLALCEMPTPS